MNYYAIDNRQTSKNTDLLIEYEMSSMPIQGKENLLMSTSQLGNYITDNEFIYKIDNTGIIDRPASEILESVREKKKSEIKDLFLNSILWTDYEKMFYEKFKHCHSSDNSYDEWYDAVTVYWDESWDEYVIKKQDVVDAETIPEINAIIFNPTHALTKEEIEEIKP